MVSEQKSGSFSVLSVVGIILSILSVIRLVSEFSNLGILPIFLKITEYYENLTYTVIGLISQTSNTAISISTPVIFLSLANIFLLFVQIRSALMMGDKKYLFVPFEFAVLQTFGLACDTELFSDPLKASAPVIALASWVLATVMNIASEQVMNPGDTGKSRFLKLSLQQAGTVGFTVLVLGAVGSFAP